MSEQELPTDHDVLGSNALTPTNPIDEMYVRFARVLSTVESVIKSASADMGAKIGEVKYADINQILMMIKPALFAQKMVISQPITFENGHMMVSTTLICIESGRRLNFPGPACLVKADPQALGSAITYYRRYGIVSLFALEALDDDGNKAGRQARDPNNRTAAETQIRKYLDMLDRSLKQEFAADFRTEFGCGLTDLPERDHGDALGWTKKWATDPTPEATPEPEPDPTNVDGFDTGPYPVNHPEITDEQNGN